MQIQDTIRKKIEQAWPEAVGLVNLEHPANETYGEYATNIALKLRGGRQLAEKIVNLINGDEGFVREVGAAQVDGPGFINFCVPPASLYATVVNGLQKGEDWGKNHVLAGRKQMVEFAHPNTHKELHVGHMRTLITGEALARLFENAGATVFRANYQGDIGPHVAKAIWGTLRLMKLRGISWDDAEQLDDVAKAHLLGEGYVEGNRGYEEFKGEIDELNKKLYVKDADLWQIYQRTRQWSLDYYKSFYERFGTKFDRLFFESDVAERGKELVLENEGKLFERSEGAVIFDGEKYGLHKRVFVTADGNPTYEGKEMALAFEQYRQFAFDLCVHVVANEQTGYFAVVLKAIELLEPKFAGKEYHLPMGMVNLVGRKISSRTGDVLTVDGLLDEVKENLPVRKSPDIDEAVTLAAVKYSVLKVNPKQNVAFDIKQSVDTEGNSGPYIQYTYARALSVLAKADAEKYTSSLESDQEFNPLEVGLVRWLSRFEEVTSGAALDMNPSLVCAYAYELATRFNTFYNQHSILGADNSASVELRLTLTKAVAQVLENSLKLLAITPLKRM